MLKKGSTLFILVLILVIAACSQGNGNKETNKGSSANKPADGEVTLRMAWWGGQARNDMINGLLDQFEATHPGIKVTREFGNEAQYVEKVITQSVGSNTPDVFQASSFYLDDFIDRDMYLDLSDYVESGDIDLQDFEAADIEGGQKNGKQYLIAWGHILTGVIYNMDLFKEAGVQFPTNDWTWSDYAQTAKDLRQHLGDNAWATEDEGGSYRGLEVFAVQRGKSLFVENGLGIDKQDMIDWYTLWKDLRDAGVIPPPSVQAEQGGKSQDQSMLAKRKVAMISTSSNQLKTYQGSMKDELNLVSYPWMPDARKETPMIISGIGMSKDTKHPKEAAILINWLINDAEAAKTWMAEHGQPPSKKMQEVIASEIDLSQKKEFAYFDSMLPTIKPYPILLEGSTAVQKLIQTENENIAFGNKTVEKAAEDFITQANKILKR